MKTPTRLALAVTLALIPAPALAHEFWLTPSTYALVPGQVATITARTGEGFRGPAKPWASERNVRFMVRASRLIDLSNAALGGDQVWVRFAPTDRGGAMLAFESTFTPIQLPGVKFNAYLKEDGLDAVRAARGSSEEPGRERYRRCAKTWLRGNDVVRATKPLGLPLEVVPRSIPGRDSVLTVEVLRGGHPLPGALVRAWRSPLAVGSFTLDAAVRDSSTMVWEARTGANGLVTVPVAASGEWLVSLVDMVPSAAPSEADWESTWASLTFARP